MDEFTRIRTFIKVVEAGSFSAAARDASSISSVARQVQSLEDELGIRLLNRSTRQPHVRRCERVDHAAAIAACTVTAEKRPLDFLDHIVDLESPQLLAAYDELPLWCGVPAVVIAGFVRPKDHRLGGDGARKPADLTGVLQLDLHVAEMRFSLLIRKSFC